MSSFKIIDDTLDNYIQHIPAWGGQSDFGEKNSTSKKYRFINTCTIDYYLLALWWSSLESKNIISYFEKDSNENFLKIIREINENNWNRAKTIWIFDVSQRKSDITQICSFGNEYQFFTQHIVFMQRFNRFEICESCGHNSNPRDQNYIYFDKQFGRIVINILKATACIKCNNEMSIDFKFVQDFPCWLVLEIGYQVKLTVDELPKLLNLKEKNYKLLCATYNNGASHFLGIFLVSGEFYLVDDRNPRACYKGSPKKQITTCFYYME